MRERIYNWQPFMKRVYTVSTVTWLIWLNAFILIEGRVCLVPKVNHVTLYIVRSLWQQSGIQVSKSVRKFPNCFFLLRIRNHWRWIREGRECSLYFVLLSQDLPRFSPRHLYSIKFVLSFEWCIFSFFFSLGLFVVQFTWAPNFSGKRQAR